MIKYENQDVGVRRFFKLKSFVFSSGYREKKYSGEYIIAGAQSADISVTGSQVYNPGTPKSTSSLPI